MNSNNNFSSLNSQPSNRIRRSLIGLLDTMLYDRSLPDVRRSLIQLLNAVDDELGQPRTVPARAERRTGEGF